MTEPKEPPVVSRSEHGEVVIPTIEAIVPARLVDSILVPRPVDAEIPPGPGRQTT